MCWCGSGVSRFRLWRTESAPFRRNETCTNVHTRNPVHRSPDSHIYVSHYHTRTKDKTRPPEPRLTPASLHITTSPRVLTPNPHARAPTAIRRLKWKFLCLQRGLHFKLAEAPLIVDACVVLFNFICLHEGTWSSHQPVDDAQTRNGTGRAQGEASGDGEERAAEAEYLAANFLQTDWGAPGSLADRRRQLREMELAPTPVLLFE